MSNAKKLGSRNSLYTKSGELIKTEDWFKKVQSHARKVANSTGSILNTYKWFTQVKIEVNWKTKEIYLENENLRVDSSKWGKEKIWRVKVKINDQWDITEYLKWELAWEQLFTWQSAMREAKKQWKRLPADLDEFQAIIDKVWVEEFMKKLPGCRNTFGSNFWSRGRGVYFWSTSTNGDNAGTVAFGKSSTEAYRDWNEKDYGFSVRCIKD